MTDAPVNDAPASDSATESKACCRSPLARAAAMLLAGIAGGVLAALLIGRFASYFQMSPEAEEAMMQAAMSGGLPPDEFQDEIEGVSRHNLILTIGVTGAALGSLLCCAAAGVAAGLRRAAAGFVIGLALGGLCGVIGGMAAVQVQPLLAGRVAELAEILLTHLTVWTCIGAGVGLGMVVAGLPFRRWMACVIVALVAAVLTVGLQQLALMVVLPLENSTLLVPQTVNARILWAGIAGGSLGLLLGCALSPRAKTQQATQAG